MCSRRRKFASLAYLVHDGMRMKEMQRRIGIVEMLCFGKIREDALDEPLEGMVVGCFDHVCRCQREDGEAEVK